MSYTFAVLTPSQVEDKWPAIRALLEPAIPFCLGDYEVDDFRDMVKERRAFVMGVYELAELVLVCVAEVIVHPRQQVMYLLALGGKKLDLTLARFQDDINAVAKTLGVASIRGLARPAMQRFYRRFAPTAHPVGVVMELRT